MNKERLNTIIKNNSSLTTKDLEDIKALTEEFPFCQIGHVLNALAHKQNEHMLSEDKIITAAIHTGNRKNLRTLINSATETKTTLSKTTEPSHQEEKIYISKDIKTKSTPIPNKESDSINLSNRRQDISIELEQTLSELQQRKNIIQEHKEEEINEVITKEESLNPVLPIEIDKKQLNTKTPNSTNSIPDSISSSRMGDEVSIKNTSTKGSFTDVMLAYLETLEEQRVNTKLDGDKTSIIDTFIKKDPSISRAKTTDEEKKDDLARESVTLKNSFISENLAKINAKQGNFSNAINIYEQLILKYPEKKTYFAEQIEKLTQL